MLVVCWVYYIDGRAVAAVHETGREPNEWVVRAVGPRPWQAASSVTTNTTLEASKDEAEAVLRDLGWVLEEGENGGPTPNAP